MFATFDPAIGRRPYTHELAGSIVLVTDFEATAGRGPMVTATVVVGGTLFRLIPPTSVAPGQRLIIPFAFSDFPELPDAFDSSVKFQLYLNNNQTFVHHRRIVRIAPPRLGQGFAAVDHEHATIVWHGLPFNPQGLYAGYSGVFDVEYYIELLPVMIKKGYTFIVLIPLGSYPWADIDRFMSECDSDRPLAKWVF